MIFLSGTYQPTLRYLSVVLTNIRPNPTFAPASPPLSTRSISSNRQRWITPSTPPTPPTLLIRRTAMSSTRPGPKRVRSDQDHSHPAVQERESKRHEADEDDNGNGNGNGKGSAEAKASSKQSSGEARPANHQDAEWLKEGPFQVGKSWDGWETKYRQSCWCNKSGSARVCLIRRGSSRDPVPWLHTIDCDGRRSHAGVKDIKPDIIQADQS